MSGYRSAPDPVENVVQVGTHGRQQADVLLHRGHEGTNALGGEGIEGPKTSIGLMEIPEALMYAHACMWKERRVREQDRLEKGERKKERRRRKREETSACRNGRLAEGRERENSHCC